MLIASFILTGTYAQKTEMFNPKSTARTSKKVNTYLPFHLEKQMVSIEFVDDMAVMEGDIVLGPSRLYSGDVQFAIAIDGDTYRWKDGIIPYTFESGHPKLESIRAAIRHVNEKTNLKLVPRSNQTDYVSFVTADGCSSRVGRSSGKQNINIGNCSYGSIIHEILHAAGLWHEQSREDRNENVTIHWDNIKEDKKHNFERHVSDGIDIGSYDCGSIMHYSAYAFSKNGRATITSTECSTLGQRQGMSPRDISAINQLYRVKLPNNLANRPWFIEAKHSRKVVEIGGGKKNAKANVQQFQLNQSDAQKFRFLRAGDQYFYIQNVNSDLVLDVQGGRAVAGTNVWQFNKNGSDAQKWRLIDAGDNYYYIRSKLGNLNLEVIGGVANGANVRVAATKGGSSQQFRFKEAQITAPPRNSYVKALEHYWDGRRADNFSTASTTGKNNAVRGKYQFVRVDGYVLTKSSSVEGKTTPLYLYYNDARKDHFTTASALGIRAAKAGGYRKVAMEGYVLSSVNVKYRSLYKPLWLYYHAGRKDNFVTASQQGMRAAENDGYRKVRIEGYVRKDKSSNLATPNRVIKN
ncbi:MAG: hypothetical protein Sapg2KO_01330 [Saprospiraceae bacterium]